MVDHAFGGPWTEEKLTRLRKYLEAYTVIFTHNPKARRFRRVYVDAFAGTGIRRRPSGVTGEHSLPLFEEDCDAQQFMKGSAQVALDVEPPFHEYFFIEKDPAFAQELASLKRSYPALANRIMVRNGDANKILVEWATASNWRSQRAVVFIDPYGMQVEWPTLEALADTKAVDLWLLFPLGQGVNRLLTRGAPPTGAWADRLTAIFGTDEWRGVFYRRSDQLDLFDNEPHYEKSASFESITQYFVKRLDSIFEKVAPNPLVLRNSKNNPIFLLCFAAANKKGATTAVKIARDLLGG
jgi:three-Cys-motif partner protein